MTDDIVTDKPIELVESIPTVMAYRDGVLVHSQAGAMPPAMLADLIDQVQALDMDRVRAAIAERESASGRG